MTTPTPPPPPTHLLPYTALKTYRERIRAMLDDPECHGDLLLLGLSLLDYAVLRTTRDEKTFKFYADQVFDTRWNNAYRIKDVLRGDIRRYDALADDDTSMWGRTCGAPMIRRHGPCGQSASAHRAMLTDPDTGRKQWVAACKRHGAWFEATVLANRRLVEQHEHPVRPAANAGGVLRRHIPEIGWEAVWLDIDPKWTAPPEDEPVEVPLRPRLTLLLGGAS